MSGDADLLSKGLLGVAVLLLVGVQPRTGAAEPALATVAPAKGAGAVGHKKPATAATTQPATTQPATTRPATTQPAGAIAAGGVAGPRSGDATSAKQEAKSSAQGSGKGKVDDQEKKKKKQKLAVTALPIPIFNPTIDFALGGVVLLTYPLDKADYVSPHSVSQAFGMGATNGSWAVGALQKLYIDQDRWRVLVGVGGGRFNSQFFGIGGTADLGLSVALQQNFVGGVLRGLRLIWNRIYGGIQYRGIWADSQAELGNIDETLTKSEVASGVGAMLEYDTRDSQFSARRGFLVDVHTFHNFTWIGSDTNHTILTTHANFYFPIVTTDHILATRFSGRFAMGDVPFFDLSVIGSGPDLRGYQAGRYRDNVMTAIQTEYRWSFWWRFGLVAFAGIGGVAEDLGKIFSATPLYSFGGGLRFTMVEDQNIKARFDVARGRDETAFYFSLSEAF